MKNDRSYSKVWYNYPETDDLYTTHPNGLPTPQLQCALVASPLVFVFTRKKTEQG